MPHFRRILETCACWVRINDLGVCYGVRELDKVSRKHCTTSNNVGLFIFSFDSAEDVAFFGRGIQGVLPTELGLLTNMKYFVASGNAMEGTVPSEIGLLSDLRALDLVSAQ